jgi:hypothetical protein
MATFERHEGRNLKGIDPDAKDRDLEQYGVWVKAEPQDVLEEPDIEDASLLSEAPEGAAVLDESFLTDEEEVFLGAGDRPAGQLPAEDADVFLSSSDTPSLHEEELSVPSLEEEPAEPAELSEDLPRIPDMAEFESLEDLGVPIEEFTPAEIQKPSPRGPEPEEFQEISDFGLEEAEPVLEAGTETDFEALDIDLKFDDTLPSSPAAQGAKIDRPQASSADGFETVTDFDDFLSGPDAGPAETAEPLSAPAARSSVERQHPAESDEFSLEDIPDIPGGQPVDDLAELERDLSAGPGRPSPRASAADSSSDILLKIAGELSSIKEELVSLKSQIAAMKSASPAPGEGVEEAAKAESGKAGGFFDEEEDETIALTGDELDNILNTAEFSEESAEPAPVQEVLETGDALEDLLPETGDYTPTPAAVDSGTSGIEELHLSDDLEGEEAPIPSDEGIAMLAEEGVAPLTAPPEDTSYLEDAEDLELAGGEDLPEAPLLEPSPEELNIDELVEEGFEEAEELPLAEFESAEGLEEAADLEEESEELEELTLDLDSETSPIVLESPENIELPIPEIEETEPGSMESAPEFVEELAAEEDTAGLGEITLHHEESPVSGSAGIPEIAEPEPVAFEEEPRSRPGSLEEPETLLVEDLEPEEPPKPEQIPNRIKDEVRSVLTYLDKLLEALPEEKIEEFAQSEHYETYKRLFEELGLV